LSHFAAAQNATNTKKPNRVSALPQASGPASEAVSLSPSEGERCKQQPRSHAKATVQGATARRCIRLSEEENKERIIYCKTYIEGQPKVRM